jgi:glutaredoxin
MITLYVRPGCPFCKKTLAAAEALDVPLMLKDIPDGAIAAELMERGGKIQVPYMVDPETHTEMYESDDIISYLHEQFGKDSVQSPANA